MHVWRLGDDRDEVFRPHDAAHATTASEAGFTVAGVQLVHCATGDGSIEILLPMLTSRP